MVARPKDGRVEVPPPFGLVNANGLPAKRWPLDARPQLERAQRRTRGAQLEARGDEWIVRRHRDRLVDMQLQRLCEGPKRLGIWHGWRGERGNARERREGLGDGGHPISVIRLDCF